MKTIKYYFLRETRIDLLKIYEITVLYQNAILCKNTNNMLPEESLEIQIRILAPLTYCYIISVWQSAQHSTSKVSCSNHIPLLRSAHFRSQFSNPRVVTMCICVVLSCVDFSDCVYARMQYSQHATHSNRTTTINKINIYKARKRGRERGRFGELRWPSWCVENSVLHHRDRHACMCLSSMCVAFCIRY